MNTLNNNIEEEKPDFTSERLANESFEDYKLRRKAIKRWQMRAIFSKNEDDHNRDYLRGKFVKVSGRYTSGSKLSSNRLFKIRFRATKPLKKIRNSYFYGSENVTYAIQKCINPVTFIQVNMLKRAKEKMSPKEEQNAVSNNIVN